MDADQAITIIETVLAPKHLNTVQIRVVRGVIAGSSYQEIIAAAAADDLPGRLQSGTTESIAKADNPRSGKYQLSYIKETGAQLWQSLSQKLGQKVTKKSLAAVLLWYTKQPESSLGDGEIEDRADLTARSTNWGDVNLGIEDRFYGRTIEIALLTNWCLHERCRLILLVGMGGMGKTRLTWEIAHQFEHKFDRTIWRSLLNAPTVTELCADLLQCFSSQPQLELPNSVEGRIELVISCLKVNRCLLILDNVESILAGQVQSGQYLLGYGDYDRLFRAIGELPHQSCAILTSREQPHTIARSQIVNPQLVRSIAIGGMMADAAHQFVQSYGCPQLPAQIWQEIYAHYGGNPLALKIVTMTAVEITGGGAKILELYPLMKQGKLQFRDIDDVLARQFERLSEIEQQLVYWLAIEREPVTGSELRSNLLPDGNISGIINALQSLARRCIITAREKTWSIQPVTIAYLTSRSINLFVAELSPDRDYSDLRHCFSHLNTYAMIKATTKDYLRQAQIQSILMPILDRLLQIWANREDLRQHLQQILAGWRTLDPIPTGYLTGNILNLAIALSPDRTLKDFDCSQLPIRSADLANVNLDHVNFTAARFDRSLFTQAFGGIVATVCHPAGNLVATSDATGDISLWQIADGQRVAIYQGHTDWTRSLAFNLDGTILASSSEDGTVRFWDTQTSQQIGLLGPYSQTFKGISFSQDGQRLVTGGDDCLVRIYDLPKLLAAGGSSTVETHCIQSLTGHSNWVFSSIYSPDQRRLASSSADGTVRIWDLETGSCLHVLAHAHWVIRSLFSPDGRYLIVSGLSATIYVWDAVAGKLLQTLTGHLDWVWSIALSSDGRTLFSTGEDRTIRVWDLPTGGCQMIFHAHQDRIWTISLTPDGQHLISGSEDRTIKIWDLQRRKCVKTIKGYGNWIKAIVFVPNRDWLASCHRDCTIRLWSVRDRSCIHTLCGHTGAVLKIAISPDGNYLASSSLDRTIRIWDLQSLTCLHTIETQVEGSCTLVFSPDGNQLISGNYDGALQLWDVATGKLNRVFSGHPNRIQSVAVCQVNDLIATACEQQIRIWDLHTGACLQTIFAHHLPVMSLAYSPDGSYLASGSMDKTAKIWDTNNWECLQTLTGHRNSILDLTFSPTPVITGTLTDYQLIVGSSDRLIKRWNIITGECLQTYTGHTNWIWSIACSPDGASIASGSEDQTIKIWDIHRPQALDTLQLKPPYAATNITGVTGLTSGQIQSLKLLGAIEN
jgi:WD40 repeat protein